MKQARNYDKLGIWLLPDFMEPRDQIGKSMGLQVFENYIVVTSVWTIFFEYDQL